MSDFDPYYKWLGIPPQEQPANHYRMLGLPNFETDADVIENAVDQRMSHVRTFQSGKHSQLSQRILNELSSARVCLLNPDQKSQYDASLFAQLQQAQFQSAPQTQAPFQPGAQNYAAPASMIQPNPQHQPVPADPFGQFMPQQAQSHDVLDDAPLFTTNDASTSTIMRKRSRKSNRGALIGGIIGVVLVAAGAAIYLNVNRTPKDVANITDGSTNGSTDGNNNLTTDSTNVKPDDDTTNSTDNNHGNDNGNHGSNNNSSTGSNQPVKDDPPPHALKLDGRDYITIPNARELLDWTKPFTVEYWANWNVESKELAFFGQWGQQADKQATGWGLTFMPAEQGKPFQLFVRFRNGEGKSIWYYKQMGQDKLDRWHHFALCNDKEQLNLYLDGEQICRFPVKPLAPSDNQPAILSIGSDPNQMGFGASSGEIRGFRVSSGVRYAGPFTPTKLLLPDETTELSLDFSKPDLNEIRDLSKNGRHGKIVGASWINSAGEIQSLAGAVPAMKDGAIWQCTEPKQGTFKKTADGWLHETEQAGTEYYEVDRTQEYVELATVVGNNRLRLTQSEVLTWDRLQTDWKPYYTGTWQSESLSTVDVDLLSKIDFAKHVRVGKVTYDGAALTMHADGTWDQVIIPYTPPGNYEVEARVTRLQGDKGFAIGLIVAGRPCKITVDGLSANGTHASGLGFIDQRGPVDPGYVGAHKGTLLTNGKESTIRCEIRRDVVQLFCDDQQVYEWTGDASKLSLSPMFGSNETKSMFVADFQSAYRVSKLTLRPLQPISLADAGGANDSMPINLLSEIDIKKNTVRGTGMIQGGVLTMEATGTFAQVMVPYTLPAEYEIDLRVTRLAGEHGFTIGLIVGGRQCMVTLDGWPEDGGISGMDTVNGRRPGDSQYNNPHRGRLLMSDQESIIRCKVTPKEVYVYCDEREVVHWQGDPSELGVYSMYRPPTDNQMFLVLWQSKFRVRMIELRSAIPSDDPPPTTFGKATAVVKLAVPSVFDQAEGKKKVESNLGDQLAKATDAESKSKLATQLIEYSKDTAEEVATRYVLLTLAYELALDAVNLVLVLDVLNEVDRQFKDVDVWKLKLDALSKINANTKSLGDRTNLASAAVALVDRALATGRIDVAIETLAIASSAAAPPAGNVDLRKAIVERKKSVEALKPEWDVAKAAVEKLKTDSTDGQANAVWGQFLCLVQRSWETGLPHLAGGSDAKLKAVAEKDLDQPSRADDQIALADEWWNLADGLTGRKKDSAQLRARLWYERAAPFAETLLIQEIIKQRLEATAALVRAKDATGTIGVTLPDNLPPEFAGMIGHMWIEGANTGVFFRYTMGHTITDNQIEDLLARANKSRKRVSVVLQGVLHVPEKTTVTVQHNGGYYYETNRVLIEGVGGVSIVGGDLRDASGNSKRSETVTVELAKGEHNVQWELNGKYGDFGSRCDLIFLDANGKAMTLYHTRKMFTLLHGRNKDVPEIRLGQ